jgi:hypothetical protein
MERLAGVLRYQRRLPSLSAGSERQVDVLPNSAGLAHVQKNFLFLDGSGNKTTSIALVKFITVRKSKRPRPADFNF